MKTLVTGATGFVGSAIVRRLLKENVQVRCLVRDTEKARKFSGTGTEIFKGDLSDISSLGGICDGCDTVFHAGAKVSDWGKRSDFMRINVEATRALLEQSKSAGVRQFVFISSSTVVWSASPFRPHALENIDERFPYPEKHSDFYNESKAAAERIVIDFNGAKMKTVSLRPSNVWGAGDTVVLPKIAQAAKAGVIFSIGGGAKTVTPCHVENLAQAALLSAGAERAGGRIYFINDSRKIRCLDFIGDQLAAAGIEWKPPKFSLPYFPLYAAGWMFEKIFSGTGRRPPLNRFAVGALSGTRTYETSRARREIGYGPVVGYDEGMKALADWVRASGGKDFLLNLK